MAQNTNGGSGNGKQTMTAKVMSQKFKSGIRKFKISLKYDTKTRVITIIVASLVVVALGIMMITSLINSAKVKAVEELISVLPDNAEYYMDYYDEIVDAYTEFNELSPSLQERVSNSDKLFACMEDLDVEAAVQTRMNIEFTEADGGWAVKVKEDRVTAASGVLELPASYRGQPVTTIPQNAFAGCTNITSVIVPDSVTSIGTGAFSGCSRLTSITLPFVGANRSETGRNGRFGYIFGTTQYAGGTAVNFGKDSGWSTDDCYIPSQLKEVVITDATNLVSNAFYNCAQLTTITLNDGILTVGDSAFAGCTNLTSVELPGITNISSYMLSNCTSLTSFTICDKVTTISSRAFNGCSALTKLNSEVDGEFIVPATVTSIGDGAFAGCTAITKITLPFVGASNTETGRNGRFGYIFGTTEYAGGTAVNFGKDNGWSTDSCYLPSQLKEVVITNATSLVSNAFYNCAQLTSIALNPEVLAVGEYAFAGCSNIKTIDLPGIMAINTGTFLNCTALETFSINEKVTTISASAFKGCMALNRLNSSVDGEFVVPETVTSIGDGAFAGCIKMTKITLPFVGASRTETGRSGRFGYIFGTEQYAGGIAVNFGKDNGWSTDSCYLPSQLRTVIITDAIQIVAQAFCNCTTITSLTLNPSVQNTVGTDAFKNCGATPVYN